MSRLNARFCLLHSALDVVPLMLDWLPSAGILRINALPWLEGMVMLWLLMSLRGDTLGRSDGMLGFNEGT